MRSAVAGLIAAIVLLVGAWARADVKIGYVDLQRALNEVEEGKQAKGKLKKEFDEKQKMLDEKQDELKKMKEELDRQGAVLSGDLKQKKQSELQQKFIELQSTYAKLQSELSRNEAGATKEIFAKMEKIIQRIAQRENFTYVLERTESSILYAPPSLDLTNELVRLYNEENKAAGGAKKTEPKKSESKK